MTTYDEYTNKILEIAKNSNNNKAQAAEDAKKLLSNLKIDLANRSISAKEYNDLYGKLKTIATSESNTTGAVF